MVVDDHEIVREGIRTIIGRSRPEWIVCGEASNGEQAIEAVKALKPDVAVLDITMPGLSGLEAASQITKLGLGCRVLVFTMHESERLSTEVRQAGAQGYVRKSQAGRDLIRAIEELLSGGTFFGSQTEPEGSSQPEPERKRDDGPTLLPSLGLGIRRSLIRGFSNETTGSGQHRFAEFATECEALLVVALHRASTRAKAAVPRGICMDPPSRTGLNLTARGRSGLLRLLRAG